MKSKVYKTLSYRVFACNFDDIAIPTCGYLFGGTPEWKRQAHVNKNGVQSFVMCVDRQQNSPPSTFGHSTLSLSGTHCLRFSYLLAKKTITSSSFSVKYTDSGSRVWTVQDNEQLNIWLPTQVTLHSEQEKNIQYHFEASGADIQMYLDDIELFEGSCGNSCSNETCSNNGKCVDRVNSFVCFCKEGFEGHACEIEVTCPNRSFPSNGKFESSSSEKLFKAGTILTYSCNDGYKISGKTKTECLMTNKWSNPAPTCTAESKCSDRSWPKNGKFVFNSQLKTFSTGTTLTYSCNKGHQLIGESKVTCHSGKWSHLAPECEESMCPSRSFPSNGKFESSSSEKLFKPGTILTYSCNDGYNISGQRKTECLMTNNWSNPAPTCAKIFASTQIGSCNFDSTSDPLCGYILHLGQNKWNRTPFKSANGIQNFVMTANRVLASLPSILCSRAITASGLHCLKFEYFIAKKQTSSSKFYIKEKSRGKHIWELHDEEPLNKWLKTQVTLNPIKEIYLQYYLEVSGNAIEIHVDNIQLFKGQCDSACTSTACSNNGYCVDRINSFDCICNEENSGRNCNIESKCSDRSWPKNGKFVSSSQLKTFSTGTTLTYSCNKGHKLIGESKITCQSGKWSHSAPECEVIEIVCSTRTWPTNGQFKSSSLSRLFKHGVILTYSCNDGYQLQGAAKTLCLSTGKWSHSSPICIEAKCTPMLWPSNGKFVSNTAPGLFKHGTTLLFSCNKGYRLVGDVKSTCQSTKSLSGKWTHLKPKCIPTFCETRNWPDNGSFRTSNALGLFNHGTVLHYICKPGYKLHGEETTTCLSSGNWSHLPPVCKEILCPTRSKPNNGNLRSKNGQQVSFTFGSALTYSCNTGYKINGYKSATCLGSARWSQPAPTCKEIQCNEREQPSNGKFESSSSSFKSGTILTYSCEVGYVLKGEIKTTCLITGNWSNFEPVCKEIICPKKILPSNGNFQSNSFMPSFKFGETLTYSCNQGYTLTGEVKIKCLESGSWSDLSPSCTKVLCPEINNPVDGNFKASSFESPFSFGGTITYSCKTDHILIGEAKSTCLVSGEWSNPSPECVGIEKLFCNESLSEPHLKVYFVKRPPTVGTSRHFLCDQGYTLVGNGLQLCEKGGKWSEVPPRCEANGCNLLPNLENGRISYSNNQDVYSIATYSCDDGFKLGEVVTSICQPNKKWSITRTISCNAIECPPRLNPLNGVVSGESRSIGSLITYSCKEGFQLEGKPDTECLSTGQWSITEEPTCIKEKIIECPLLKPPIHGRVLLPLVRAPGTLIIYACDKGFQIKGEVSATCLSNGQWSVIEEPKCEEIRCSEVRNPLNGYYEPIINDPGKIGSIIRYSCNSGYRLFGYDIQVCGENGRWTTDVPECRELHCSDRSSILNGVLESNSDESKAVGSEIRYRCNSGYRLNGVELQTCKQDGTWSSVEPTCEVIVCRPPTQPANGQVKTTFTTVGGVVTYSCDPGFELRGESTAECLSDGEWSIEEEPTCINLADKWNNWLICSVTCGGGVKIRTCVDETCVEIKPCNLKKCISPISSCQLPLVSNGRAKIQSTISIETPPNIFTVGDTVSLECDPYFTASSAASTCSSGGAWIPELKCTPSVCEFNAETFAPSTLFDFNNKPIGPWYTGDMIRIACSDGTGMTIVCARGQQWTSSDVITNCQSSSRSSSSSSSMLPLWLMLAG